MPGDIDDDFPVVNRSAIVVKPTGEFVSWLKAVPGDPFELTWEDVQDDSSVYLLPDELDDLDGWLERNYMAILEQELLDWSTDDSLWPEDLSFESFKRLFQITFQTMVYDLGKGPVESGLFDADVEDENLDAENIDPE